MYRRRMQCCPLNTALEAGVLLPRFPATKLQTWCAVQTLWQQAHDRADPRLICHPEPYAGVRLPTIGKAFEGVLHLHSKVLKAQHHGRHHCHWQHRPKAGLREHTKGEHQQPNVPAYRSDQDNEGAVLGRRVGGVLM